MNIIEAIKSGKPFRRKDSDIWNKTGTFDNDYKNELIYEYKGQVNLSDFSREDILADDWIVDEQKVVVTATQIREAYRNVKKSIMDEPISRLLGVDEFQEKLIKELGL